MAYPEAMTIHAFSGFGIGDGTVTELVNIIRARKGASKRIKELAVLIFDEVSLISDPLPPFDRDCHSGGSTPFHTTNISWTA